MSFTDRLDKANDFIYWEGMGLILILFLVAAFFKLTVMVLELDDIKTFPKIVISIMLFTILILLSMIIFNAIGRDFWND
jgi:hypothetical protein